MKIAIRSLLGLATFVLVAAGHQTPANAQTAISALVTATCGTPGITLTAGRQGVVTQNTSGQLCTTGTGGGGGGGAVFGPTAVGSAAANPPVLMGGTANGTGTGSVAVAEIKAGNAFGATDPSVGVADANVLSALNTGNGSLATIATNTGSAIPAGTAIIGKVGIDQTTPGTTNGVQVNAALPAGTNLLGKTGIDQSTPGTTNAVSPGTIAGGATFVKGTTSAAMTGTSATQILAAVASKVLYVTRIKCNNSSATATLVQITDGSGGTVLDTLAAGATYGGEQGTGPTPLFWTTSGNGLFAQNVTTGASVLCTASGYSG